MVPTKAAAEITNHEVIVEVPEIRLAPVYPVSFVFQPDSGITS